MPAPYPQKLRKTIITWIDWNALTASVADSQNWAIVAIELETAANRPTATLQRETRL